MRPTLHPFVKILPLVVVGIVLGDAFDMRWWVTALAAAVCIAGGILFRKKSGIAATYTAFAVLFVATTTTTLRTTPLDLPYNQPIECTATIVTIPTLNGHRHRCEGRVELAEGVRTVEINADTALHARLGDRVVLRTILRELPEGGYGELMRRRGISGRCWVDHKEDWVSLENDKRSLQFVFTRAQEWLLGRFDQLSLDGDTDAVCKAMAFGHRGEMSRTLHTNYARAGAAHLLAISGLHIGIVAMLVWALCGLLPLAIRRGHIWRNVICAVVMIVYALLTGGSPSVLRATLMFCIVQLAFADGGGRSALNVLCGALAVMLVANPNNLYDISFRLSAVAVGGIMLGYGPLMEQMRCRWRPLNWVLGVVIVGLCSTLATLPIVSNTFGVVALAGIVLNPVVILTANVIVLGSLVWVLLPFDFLRGVFRFVVGGAAELQNRCVEVVSGWDWAVAEVSIPDWLTVVCYAAMVALVATLPMAKMEKRVWKEKI